MRIASGTVLYLLGSVLLAFPAACFLVDDKARPDTTSPQLLETYPIDGQRYVNPAAVPRFTFSEGLDPATIDDQDFVLTDLTSGLAVPFTVHPEKHWGACPDQPCILGIQIHATFQEATDYQLELIPDITDQAGNPLLSGTTIRFRTSRILGLPPVDPNGCRYYGSGIWCGDVDNDGLDDAAVLETRRLTVFHGPDASRIQTVTGEYRGGGFATLLSLSGGDIDGDGFGDLVCICYDVNLQALYIRVAHGPDLSRIVDIRDPHGLANWRFGDGVVVADVNGDTFEDVIAQGYVTPTTVNPTDVTIVYGPDLLTADRIPEPAEVGPYEGFAYVLAAGDVDDDGLAEVVASGEDRVFVFRGGSPTGYDILDATSLPPEPHWGLGWTIAVEDITGDGIGDVVAPATARVPNSQLVDLEVFVWPGPGLAGPSRINLSDQAYEMGVGRVAVDDVDGDGAVDVVLGSAGQHSIWVSMGPTFDQVHLIGGPFPLLTWSNQWIGTALDTGDINGDGAADIIPGATTSGAAGSGCLGGAWIVFGP